MMDAPHIIPILRLCVLVEWAFVVWLSLPGVRRATGRKAETGDYKDLVSALVGVALIGFQLNAISKAIPPRTDTWTAIFLALLSIGAAADLVLVHLPRTPEGHKRPVVWTALAIFAACIVGGSLA